MSSASPHLHTSSAHAPVRIRLAGSPSLPRPRWRSLVAGRLRFDDRPGFERFATPSEAVLRQVGAIHPVHR